MCVLLSLSEVYGTAPEFVSNEVIVKFKDATTLTQARAALDGEQFSVEKALVDLLDIYLVKIVDEGTSESEAIADLQMDENIEWVQLNHLIALRAIPNDPEFSNQWALNQVFDHDIDAPEAWDFTTGGYDMYGGKVSIGVVDDGRYTSDLADNLWYNQVEIYGVSGQDDDGNLVVDDFYGWNAWDDSNLMWYSEHAAHVSGIIGAVGNNGTSISGVNWTTQLVPVIGFNSGSPVSTDVVSAALNYLAHTKERWLASNGIQGANIVAANLSFGIDYADCASEGFPVWNDLFNYLGSIGIISIGATANLAINVDTEGDVPTGCTSEYLISVTNTMDTDELSSVAAWGEESIDLGAPGTSVLSLFRNGDVIENSGTSMSAAHVSGAVGLLHSVPNPSFRERYFEAPAEASRELKGMILSGIDLVDDLDGNTVSGGRLNLVLPIQEMNDYYHDNGHDVYVPSSDATGPAGSANMVYTAEQPRYEFTTYSDHENIIYRWREFNTGGQTRYYLLSKPTGPSDEDNGTGKSPTVAYGRHVSNSAAIHVVLSWIADGPSYDSVKVLVHKPEDTEVTDRFWKLGNLGAPRPWDGGVAAELTAPIAVGGDLNYPTVFVGARNVGAASGIYCWRAPLMSCPDYLEWPSSRIPVSNGQNVTSVAVDRADASDFGNMRIHVAWTTNANEVFYHRGVRSGTQYLWTGQPSIELSEGLIGVSNVSNVTICYSPYLGRIYVAWEGTYDGRRDIWVREGEENGTNITWEDAYRLVGEEECVDRRAPHIQPLLHNGANDDGVCPVGLVYERKPTEELIPMIEARGLIPDGLGNWVWGEPQSRGLGYKPTISGRFGSVAHNYNVCFTRPAAVPTNPEPYYVNSSSVTLNYPIANPPVMDLIEPYYVECEETWTPPITLDRPIIVRNGGHLIITSVYTSDCAAARAFGIPSDSSRGMIEVESGGALTITGTSRELFKFESADASKAWGGITVKTGGSLSMDYVEMKDCSVTCVKTLSPASVEISNCTFFGNKMGTDQPVLSLLGSPSVTQVIRNTTITDVPAGLGLFTSTCDVDIEELTVEDCKYANSYIKATTGSFRKCTFSGRPTQYGVSFQSTGNTPNFQCCRFDSVGPLSGTLKYALNVYGYSAPSFGYSSGSVGTSNVVVDSCFALMRMFGNTLLPIIANPPLSSNYLGGANDWTQNMSGGYYLYRQAAVSNYYAKQQWWNRKPLGLNDFYPDSTYFFLGDSPASAWGVCAVPTSSIVGHVPGREGALDDDPTSFDSLFAVAMSYEIDRDYEQSQPLFRQVASGSDNYGLVWQAMLHASANQRFLEGESDGSWISVLIDSLVPNAPEGLAYETEVTAERLKGNYFLSIGEYDSAINTLVDLLESDLTEADSLYTCIDLLTIYSLAGLDSAGGSLDQINAGNRVPIALQVTSSDEAWQVERGILARLALLDEASPQQAAPEIPTEFRLYQNYPNPFNPTTQIEFDLPEAVRVTLKVFNTLGQEVATVSDEMMPAGHHVATWNGKSNVDTDVATGLYIYQIHAGSFTDTKKMVLMK
ncbi:MAG: S8 family peptidase [bacterium]|nr:S8 family peptidase [bacterium]